MVVRPIIKTFCFEFLSYKKSQLYSVQPIFRSTNGDSEIYHLTLNSVNMLLLHLTLTEITNFLWGILHGIVFIPTKLKFYIFFRNTSISFYSDRNVLRQTEKPSDWPTDTANYRGVKLFKIINKNNASFERGRWARRVPIFVGKKVICPSQLKIYK